LILRLTKLQVMRTRGEKSISPLRGSGKKGTKVGPLNLQRCERRGVLALSLVDGRTRRELMEERAIPISQYRVSQI
jgi:hypothetical protein